jgi:mannosylglycerate hydrolase
MPRTTYHLIPHTHWDREWYLTQAGFLPRLVAALDDLLRRLDREPGFRSFLLDGQTVLAEDYLRARPEQAATLAALVRSGRLQVGPWYVLADELIPSGESLVRNLLLGSADAARLGGRLDVLYSPDAFGHPAAWPSLAAEFDISYGVLWRGLGGEPGQEGDLYRWRDRAGREVRLYHLPPDGYEVGAALAPDPARLGAAWAAVGPALRARSRTSQVAVFVGADHHAAHPDPDALRSALSKLEPDADVRVSRLDEFLRAAWDEAPNAPVLSGELRWSYGYTWTLQGVHGTRAPLKRLHADAELRLERLAEPLAALDRWHRAVDRRPVLEMAWRTLVRAQFHDSIAGCTSDPVARRVLARIEDAVEMAAELEREALHSLAGYDADAARDAPERVRPELLLWNPAPRTRSGIVVADLAWFRRDVLVGPPGTRKPREAPPPSERDITAVVGGQFQILGRRPEQHRLDSARHYPDQDEVQVVRVAIPAPETGGFAIRRPGAGTTPPAVRVLQGGGIANGRLAVGVDARGRIWLRDLTRELELPSLLRFESEPDAGDTYTFARGKGRLESSSRWQSPVVLARGPLVGAIETRTRLLGGRVTARLVLTLHAGSDALRCTLELDNQARDYRLRLRCAAPGPLEETMAGAAFGVARRSIFHPDRRYANETPVATAPAHRFVAGNGAADSVVVFAPGFFEYGAESGSLLLTLLRAVGQLSRDDLPTRAGHAGWPTQVPDAQCLGRERLQLGFTLTSPRPSAAALARAWEDLFLPPRALWIRQSLGVGPVEGGLELQGDGLVFSALKPSSDGRGVVMRCYNPGDQTAEGVIMFDAGIGAAVRVTAGERECGAVRLAPDRRSVALSLSAGEILSLRIDPE